MIACEGHMSSVCVNADKFYRRPQPYVSKGRDGHFLSGVRRPALAPEETIAQDSRDYGYFGNAGTVTSLSLK
jgi:hypothetical protein